MVFYRERRAFGVGVIAVTTLMTPVAIAQQPATQQAAPVAQAANADSVFTVSFKNLKDEQESLAPFKGKVVVIYFWATWCVPCRLETPKLVKLYGDFKTKNTTVIGIALDNGDKVRAFVGENDVTYPTFYGGHDAVKLGKELGNDQGAIPFMVVIDKTGKIVETIKGDTPNGKLEAILAPLAG